MKKFLIMFGFAVVCCILSACLDENQILQADVKTQGVLSQELTGIIGIGASDSIFPLKGDSLAMRKQQVKAYSASSNSNLQEELKQLDQIPIYLQVKGNTSTKQFLAAGGEGKEVSFDNYKANDLSQQFYIKILPGYMGIPYMIYSNKTKTPISLGAYSSNPDVKVVYVKPSSDTSTFGASWDIRYGEYSPESFVIENQDYPRQGSSGVWYDIYYSVITANDSKVSLEKYAKSPRQEFSIIPVEDFKIESVTFDTNASTLACTPNVVFSDRFTNNGPIAQNHTFAISDSYKKTSSFNRKTAYNLNVTTTFKTHVPFVANGEISTSTSFGQEFTYGKTEEQTFTINRTYPIEVPSNYTAQMTLTLSKYTMDVEYCAVCVGVISGKRINIRGIWKGVDVQESDAVLKLTPINGAKMPSKIIHITDKMKSNPDGYVKVD